MIFIQNRSSAQVKYYSYSLTLEPQEEFENNERALEIWKTVSSPIHLQTLHQVTRLLELSLQLEKWEVALKYAKLKLQLYQKIYKENWPLISIQLFMVGKLYWYLQKTGKSVKMLKKAEESMKYSHGSEAQLYNQVERQLEEAQAELLFKNNPNL